MNLQSRLQEFISYNGLSVSAFEKKCGFGNGTVKRFNEKSKNRTFNAMCSAFPELNKEWLLTGEGEMIRKDTTIGDVSGNDNMIDSPVTQSIGEVSGQNAGRDINNSSVCAGEPWLKELEAQRKLTEKAQSIAETAQTQLSIALAQITDLMNQNKEQFSYFMTLFQSKKQSNG